MISQTAAPEQLQFRPSKSLVVLALAALLWAPATFAQSAAPDTSSVVLVPGDVLRIAVWGKAEFSGDFVLAPNGTITHPLLREIRVAGVPIPLVEQRIRAFLSRYVAEPAFVITPLLHVFVGGEVKNPGNYLAPPGTTIDQAMVLAGGWTTDSQLERVLLVRERAESTLDLRADQGRQGITAVHSGDQILVGQRHHAFRDVIAPTLMFLGFLTGVANLLVSARK